MTCHEELYRLTLVLGSHSWRPQIISAWAADDEHTSAVADSGGSVVAEATCYP